MLVFVLAVLLALCFFFLVQLKLTRPLLIGRLESQRYNYTDAVPLLTGMDCAPVDG